MDKSIISNRGELNGPLPKEPCDVTTNCQVAGDQRVNEQPGLTTMHTVWLREHNRLAGQLQAINSHWDSERVFQEARRLLIAEWQHIIYSEWLPMVLGPTYMNNLQLNPLSSGYSNRYSEDLDPRINNEFATAAFRFGHSMMPKNVPMMSKDGEERDVELHHVFNNVSMFRTEPDTVDQIVRGQTRTPAAAWDPVFNNDLNNKLFHEELDLVALNINRGRDHGLPGYNTYRGICASQGYQRAQSWEDLNFQPEVDLLREHYEDVDDIDLFVGGTLETRHHDALLGPAFTCIIGDQFIRLKEGDRFYYENGEFRSKFSLAQLSAIRKVTMARIICDNTDLEEIQPQAFRTLDESNRLTSCTDKEIIPDLDIQVFREI